MKKHLVAGIFASALLLSSVYAANLNVGELDLDFCNGGNKLNMTMDANTQTGICMRLTNLSTKTGKVLMSFVDWEMSQWESAVQACKTNAEGLFGRSITLDEPTVFDIQWGESIIKTGNLSLITGFAGNMYGCITYTVLEDTTGDNQWQMFSIVSRKANTISIFVSGDVQSQLQLEQIGQSLTTSSLVSLVQNGDKNYTLTVRIANKGTANEKLNGKIIITSDLGFHKEIPLVSNIELFPEETKDFAIPVGKLPWYGGNYSIRIELDHQPMIDGKPQGKVGNIAENTSYAFGIGKYGPLPLGAWAIIILWILLILIKKLQKEKKKRASK